MGASDGTKVLVIEGGVDGTELGYVLFLLFGPLLELCLLLGGDFLTLDIGILRTFLGTLCLAAT